MKMSSDRHPALKLRVRRCESVHVSVWVGGKFGTAKGLLILRRQSAGKGGIR